METSENRPGEQSWTLVGGGWARARVALPSKIFSRICQQRAFS
jgi:hypothetical protein